jgi:hypothetical protein
MAYFSRKSFLALIQVLLCVVIGAISSSCGVTNPTVTITVSGKQWGVSTCYIGAVEGNTGFNIADLQDLGINTYRIYGGMSRWEWQDDSSIYGYPTIAQIKANPNVINWRWWDNAMTNPPHGSDYWWDASSFSSLWQGNARTIFSQLQKAHIRPLLALRNQDPLHMPVWARRLNPPRTAADWNEWWEHVFATVYWLNVRNNYHVDDYEIHNEPDVPSQGWEGNLSDYYTFARYTHDAIDYVYKTYLPGQTYHVYAPDGPAGSWAYGMLKNAASTFDSLDYHDYEHDISQGVAQRHSWMNQTGHANYSLWLSEWGTYTGGYTQVSFAVNLIDNLIRGSRPGNDYVYGSYLFSLYDWYTTSQDYLQGLVSHVGTRTTSYYAFRLGIRALQGCRPTYQSTTNNSHLMAITTKGHDGSIYLLITNQDNIHEYNIDANLSRLLMTSNNIAMWLYDSHHMDEAMSAMALNSGHVNFTIPANAAILFKFSA